MDHFFFNCWPLIMSDLWKFPLTFFQRIIISVNIGINCFESDLMKIVRKKIRPNVQWEIFPMNVRVQCTTFSVNSKILTKFLEFQAKPGYCKYLSIRTLKSSKQTIRPKIELFENSFFSTNKQQHIKEQRKKKVLITFA